MRVAFRPARRQCSKLAAATALPRADERLRSFDAVVSNPTLHHLPDTRVAIRLRGKREHSAPTVLPSRGTVGQLRRHVSAELLGAK
jgi:hypothetical protein